VQDKYLASLGIRSIKVNNYLIFYEIDESEDNENVNVYRFVYGKRDWAKILKERPLKEIM
jgi:hypothetical protein